MTIAIKQRVTVFDKPVHGNQRNLVDGSVLSINGESAKVQIDGEDIAREFKVADLKSSESTYGYDRQSPMDNQVINGMRR